MMLTAKPRPLSAETIKERLTVYDAYSALGLEAPNKWSECLSPFREERKPSFSVFNDGRAFNDFTTGEGGDVIRFWSLARGISDKEAIKELRERLGGFEALYQTTAPTPRTAKREAPREIVLPEDTRPLEPSEYQPFANRRKLYHKAMHALSRLHEQHSELTQLSYCTYKGKPSLLIVERLAGVTNTACRRLDGRPYNTAGGSVKELCLAGSARSLPLGAGYLGADPETPIMLCEGTPDWLSAWHIVLRAKRKGKPLAAIPLGMLGASNTIHPEALRLLAGRTARIFPHVDQNGQGQKAGEKWAKQLFQYDCKVEGFDFSPYQQASGEPVTDLNELLFMKPEDQPKPVEILPTLP